MANAFKRWIASRGRMERVTILVTSALSLTLIVASATVIVSSAKTYARSEWTRASTEAVESTLLACMDFMLVRGRASVQLSREGPIAPADTAYIDERYRSASSNLAAGLSLLGRLSPPVADRIRNRFDYTLWFKSRADEAMAKPKAERNPFVAMQWSAAAGSFIRDTLDDLSVFLLENDQTELGFAFERMLILAVNYRESLGGEATILASLLEEGRPPSSEEADAIVKFLGRQEETWRNISVYTRSVRVEAISGTFELVKSMAMGEYRANLDAARIALFSGKPGPISAAELHESSVATLVALQDLMTVVFGEAMAFARRQLAEASWTLAGGVSMLLWSLAMVIVAPGLLSARVFKPIAKVLVRLNAACDARGAAGDDDAGRADELVVLARAAERLIGATVAERELNREIRHLADTDGLTGLLNRRAFLERGERIMALLSAQGKGYAVAMADLDRFKRVNDTLGHAAGDRALVSFAGTLVSGLRSSDSACRFGGEEFALLLPEADAGIALAVVERIREKVAVAPIAFRGEAFSISASFGVYVAALGETLDQALSRADAALYRAKSDGRNRSVVWDESLGA